MRVYGPYFRKDGRQHVVIVYGDGSRRTVSYPKYLMEQHLERELEYDETVHHIDGDFTNNALENLQVLDRVEHRKQDAKKAEIGNYVCANCGTEFRRPVSIVVANQLTQEKAGPFCSKRCSGTYGTDVQNNRA